MNLPSRSQISSLILETEGHHVFRGKTKIELTPKEYVLLEFLMRHPGQIVTRTMIAERVFGYHFGTSTNVIDVHISHPRNKTDKDFELKLLHTVKGLDMSSKVRGKFLR